MNKEYIVTLTETEDLALGSICKSQQEWINNAVHEICRITIENITKDVILRCMENNIPVPQTKEESVLLAFQKGWLTNQFASTLIGQL